MKNKKKKLIIFIVILFVILISTVVIVKRNVIHKANNVLFYLEEKYYGDSVFTEIESKDLDKLIDNKESFAIFIHQPVCSMSYELNKVLTVFAEENKISLYKITFDEMNKTSLSKKIKYYPSFAIFNNGKLIDYLDAESDEHLNYYKDVNEFTNWFNGYIQIKNKESYNEKET